MRERKTKLVMHLIADLGDGVWMNHDRQALGSLCCGPVRGSCKNLSAHILRSSDNSIQDLTLHATVKIPRHQSTRLDPFLNSSLQSSLLIETTAGKSRSTAFLTREPQSMAVILRRLHFMIFIAQTSRGFGVDQCECAPPVPAAHHPPATLSYEDAILYSSTVK
jgi:hypothetical protein